MKSCEFSFFANQIAKGQHENNIIYVVMEQKSKKNEI